MRPICLSAAEVDAMLARCGRPVFTWPPLPEPRGRAPGRCFAAAQRLALVRGLAYAEGIALDGQGRGLHHAWHLDETGLFAVEVSWARPGRRYRGVLFTAGEVRRHLAAVAPGFSASMLPKLAA